VRTSRLCLTAFSKTRT